MKIGGPGLALLASASVLPTAATTTASAAATQEQNTPTDATLLVDGVAYDIYDIGSGWLEYRHAVSLLDTATADSRSSGRPVQYTTKTVQGDVLSGAEGRGCSYRGEISSTEVGVGQEGLVWHQREIQTNPDRCQVKVEEAWLSASALQASGLIPGEDLSAGTVETDSSTSAQASYKNDGYIRGYVEDPPNLDVSSTTSQVKWTDNGCLSWWDESRWYWLSGSGWTDVERWNIRHGDCAHGLRTFGKYKNGIFCLTNDTWTQEDVDFVALAHQSSRAGWDVQRWGGCSWLLNGQHTYDPY
jgi:hypothetical protein